MATFLNVIFWLALSFTVVHYTLGVGTVKEPLRAILAAVFAVLYVLVVQYGKLV